MSNTDNAIDSFLRDRLDAYVDELAKLCAQPSVSARKEGTVECSVLVERALADRGFHVDKFDTPSSPIIVGRLNGETDRTLLLYNHYDVQPPEPLELWTTPPFQPAIRGGALFARGAEDDKGELVARLAAIDAVLAANGGTSPCAITFVIEGDEETGSPHIAEFVRTHTDMLRCEGAIWEGGGIDPDGNPYNILGCRGVLAVELLLETMNQDAHSGGAHILPSAAWRLVRLLVSLKGPDERIRIPGFYDQVRRPSKLDLQLVDALPTHEEFYRRLLGLKEYVLGRTGVQLNRAVFEPTCNVQGITTGYQGERAKTIVPAKASAKLDFRLVPDQEPDDILAKLHAHLAAQGFEDVAVVRHAAMLPAKTAADDPFVQLASRAGEEVYGLPTLLDPLSGGSSPIYAFARPLGDIPVVSVGTGYWDNRVHAPDEHIRLVDFLNGSRQIARIIDRFAELPLVTHR